MENKSSFNVVKKSIIFIGLGNSEDILNTDGELDISSNFIINLDASLFILADDVDLTTVECEFKVLSW